MSRLLATSRRLALGVAAFALVAGLNASARADIGYAFAEETISNLTAAGTGGTGTVAVVPLPPKSLASATLNGSGPAMNNGAAAHAEVGIPAAANDPTLATTYTKFATFAVASPLPAGSLPIAPLTSFSRGAVQQTGLGGMAVAETYVNGTDATSGSGGASNVIRFFATPSATNTFDIKFNYANDLYAVVSNPANPGNSASSQVTFQIQIQDPTGAIVFQTPAPGVPSPGNTNLSANAPPNGPEVINAPAGLTTVTTSTLTAGVKYTVTFTLAADTNVVVSAVPEPATMAMALTALPLVGFGLLRRRNRKAQA